MKCEDCANINNLPFIFCCLHECGKHIFCINCENLNRNKDLSHCKDERMEVSQYENGMF